MIEPREVPDYEVPELFTQVAAIFQEGFALFTAKNHEYGNAIELTGALGAAVALTGDVGRLRQLVITATDSGLGKRAVVRDKLLDVMVQAMIGIMMVDNNNWKGIEL